MLPMVATDTATTCKQAVAGIIPADLKAGKHFLNISSKLWLCIIRYM